MPHPFNFFERFTEELARGGVFSGAIDVVHINMPRVEL
jgi:hypothetical protein